MDQESGALAEPSSHDDATPAWLFSQGIAGNEQRFGSQFLPLVKAWAAEMLAQAGWLGRLDPDDLAQDVLVRVLARFRTRPFTSNAELGGFRAYLRQCIRHAVIDALRTASAVYQGTHHVQEYWEAVPESIDDLADRFDTAWGQSMARVREAVSRVQQRVGPVRWEAFYLFVVEKRKGAEVARQLGLTPAQVYDAKHDIKAYLREELAALGYQG